MRHWTMFTPLDYAMNKEQKADVFAEFTVKQEKTVPLMNFVLSLGVCVMTF
jgi:hypothetical protein